MAFDSVPARDLPLSDTALDQLFTEARTRNAWSDRPVSEDLLRRLYDLTKFGPTAVNATPARFVFVTSPEAKARLLEGVEIDGQRAAGLAAAPVVRVDALAVGVGVIAPVLAVGRLCAQQIVAWLSDPQARFADAQKGDKPLQPKDIAVLVRTGKEAAAVRDALRSLAWPSIPNLVKMQRLRSSASKQRSKLAP